jgi:hypothetical protein
MSGTVDDPNGRGTVTNNGSSGARAGGGVGGGLRSFLNETKPPDESVYDHFSLHRPRRAPGQWLEIAIGTWFVLSVIVPAYFLTITPAEDTNKTKSNSES